jgi:quinol-cytochrome oxidoreductase complex cytochrome b subunit
VPFYPHHLLRSFVVAVLVLTITATAAILSPRALAEPANPSQPPGTLVTSWVVADVSRALTHYLGAWGLGLFLLVGLALALLPLFDRAPERRLRRRPVVATLALLFYLGFLVAWLAGRQLRNMPPQATIESRALPAPAPDTAHARGRAP